jgi:predicted thioesterase
MEEILLKPGIQGNATLTVRADQTAIALGSGELAVFATPAMIALMEQTCMLSVGSLLPEGQTTVGTEVHVNHLKASAVGSSLQCRTMLKSVKGRELHFEIEVSDGDIMVGKGSHIRFIVDSQKFMARLL